ncbi:hypothetical protein SSBR45G_73850 [Bradyrhizobium sp. SSBR45G]|uniref:hypothetical protein n=1 Tax=unclassified Bradyrhizobium TaxID=2631580 RepID=UPI0023428FC7|nr:MULTISPECIES: hypothetical protein [unclassified Bradyrhizobium]GLH82476.1 hypothetical protein SSBR45G_73850 [Bradyrhizobium sp. SSBR45G]GLH89909.1 hypothetical protein SSBR45R_73700 [Bradyrhizobium sp. SSBR45R]
MTDPKPRLLPSALPPGEAELAEWQALSRKEQLACYRAALLHPDCLRISTATMSDILAEARRRARHDRRTD